MMLRPIVAFLAAVALLGASPAPTEIASLLTPAQEAADVALMRGAYERVHPGLYRYQPKKVVNAAFDRLADFARAPHTSLELYGAISETIAVIHCDHSKAEYPSAVERFRRKNATFFPFRFRIFASRMYVASSDPHQVAIERGSEIVSIDGHPVAEILAKLSKDVSYDGRTSAVVPSKLEADADLMGSDFEQFYPVYYGFASEHAIEVRPPNAAVANTLTLHDVSFADWVALGWPALADRSQLFNGTSWRTLDPKTAYLRVDSFVNYRQPVDAYTFFDSYFKAINDSGAMRLIVDLRYNGGGSTDGPISLARFLLDKTFTFNAPLQVKTLEFGDLPEHAQSWGDMTAFFHPDRTAYRKLATGNYEIIPGALHTDQDVEMLPIEVSPDRFTGQVIVLTGPRNASGSTMLIGKLHDEKRVTLVGEPTGGSVEGPTAGFILFVKLPNSDITVRVSDMWNRMAVTHFTPGYGAAPDVAVMPTLDDFVTDRDPILTAARQSP